MKTGINAIIKKIDEEAQQHSEKRYAQLKSTIDLDADSEKQLYREELDKQLSALKKHFEHEYERRIEYQRRRMNRELLEYKHELSDQIFAKVVRKFRDVTDEEFSAMFNAAVKELKGRYTLQLGARTEGKLDSRALEDAMKRYEGLEIVFSGETIPNKSGFVISDERVEYNCLLEDLVEDLKNDRLAAIMKEVFGDSEDWMFT